MKKKLFFLLFLGLSAIIILIILIKIWKAEPLPRSLKYEIFGPAGHLPLTLAQEKIPFLEIRDFRLVQTLGEEKEWELEAQAASEYEEGKEIEIKKTKIKFYKDGIFALHLEADEGVVELNTRDIRVWGNVKVNSREGWMLESPYLEWKADKKKLYTPEQILLIRKGIRMEGKGLEADIELGEIEIKEKIKVQMEE